MRGAGGAGVGQGSGGWLSWFCLRIFFILGLTKVPFGDYFLFFLGFLSKSKGRGGGCSWLFAFFGSEMEGVLGFSAVF